MTRKPKPRRSQPKPVVNQQPSPSQIMMISESFARNFPKLNAHSNEIKQVLNDFAILNGRLQLTPQHVARLLSMIESSHNLYLTSFSILVQLRADIERGINNNPETVLKNLNKTLATIPELENALDHMDTVAHILSGKAQQ